MERRCRPGADIAITGRTGRTGDKAYGWSRSTQRNAGAAGEAVALALLRRQPDARDHLLPLRNIAAEIVAGVGAIADPKLRLQGLQFILRRGVPQHLVYRRVQLLQDRRVGSCRAKRPTQVDATIGKPLSV